MSTHRSDATLTLVIVGMLIALSLHVFPRVAHAQAGKCRNAQNGPCPDAPTTDTTKCDPAAWKRYLQEERAVRGIMDQWNTKERAINEEEAEAFLEIIKDELFIGTRDERMVERVIEEAGHSAEDYFKHQAEFTMANLDKMSRGLKISQTVVADVDLATAIFKAAEKALYMEEAVRKAGNDSRENKKTLERADELWQQALKDLLQALAQDAACKKVLAKEKLRDQAMAIIDKWEPEGTSAGKYFYNGEAYDFGGAMHKAEEIIKSGKPTSMRSASPRLWLATYGAIPSSTRGPGYLLTRAQVDGARVQLNEARVRITRYFAAFRKDIRRRQVGRQNINSLMPR